METSEPQRGEDHGDREYSAAEMLQPDLRRQRDHLAAVAAVRTVSNLLPDYKANATHSTMRRKRPSDSPKIIYVCSLHLIGLHNHWPALARGWLMSLPATAKL